MTEMMMNMLNYNYMLVTQVMVETNLDTIVLQIIWLIQ